MNVTVADIAARLEAIAPTALAESWDNVGLLLGDRQASVSRLMTCLTITPPVVDEAVRERAELIVTHHPVLFRPVQRITSDTVEGRMLLALIAAGVAVYSPHTAFDSAAQGINQRWAEGLGLAKIRPLSPTPIEPAIGVGRCGDIPAPTTLAQLAERVGAVAQTNHLRAVGAVDRLVRRVGIACGAGGSLLDLAISAECDVLVTGEASFHQLLAAEAADLAVLLTGHYASERPAVEQLAAELAAMFATLDVWASRAERDPLRVL